MFAHELLDGLLKRPASETLTGACRKGLNVKATPVPSLPPGRTLGAGLFPSGDGHVASRPVVAPGAAAALVTPE